MKVVINACYGSFGLSDRAREWCAKRGLVVSDDAITPYIVEFEGLEEIHEGRRWNSQGDI